MKFKISAFFFSTICCCCFQAKAQQIVRSCFAAWGNTMQNNELVLLQTAGQSANTENYLSFSLDVRQGFQQPPKFGKSVHESLQVSLFPNPSNGEFDVSLLSSENGVINYKIYDIKGSLINENSSILNTTNHFNLQNLNSGIYFIALKNDQLSKQIRFVIIK